MIFYASDRHPTHNGVTCHLDKVFHGLAAFGNSFETSLESRAGNKKKKKKKDDELEKKPSEHRQNEGRDEKDDDDEDEEKVPDPVGDTSVTFHSAVPAAHLRSPVPGRAHYDTVTSVSKHGDLCNDPAVAGDFIERMGLPRGEFGEPVVLRVVEAMTRVGFGDLSVERHHGKTESLELLSCLLFGEGLLGGELCVIQRLEEATLWEPHRLRLQLDRVHAGREAKRCRARFEKLCLALDCDFGGVCTAHLGAFVPAGYVSPFGQPPACWLTVLSQREFGPVSRYESCGGRALDEGHVLLEGASPAWDFANTVKARAHRAFRGHFEGLHLASRTVEANLTTLEYGAADDAH
ncbi:MAG: hypothetical protein R3B72_51695 [Polyangiaceae bacterium]